MSFILDALRKSDTERQQQATPSLATTPQRVQKPRQKFWVPVLIVVLLLNVCVIAWIFLTDTSDTANVAARATTPSAENASQTRARSLRKEAVSSQLPQQPAPVTAITAADARPAPAAQEAPPAAQRTVTTPDVPAVKTIQPALPSFEQLLVGGIISMPQLHLDIHVYASDASKRFVFINMNKYHEGDRLSEGPVVEEITSYGAILAHEGNRFTLERD